MGRSENSINHQILVSLYSDLVDHSGVCVSWNSFQSQCLVIFEKYDYFFFSQYTVSLEKGQSSIWEKIWRKINSLDFSECGRVFKIRGFWVYNFLKFGDSLRACHSLGIDDLS